MQHMYWELAAFNMGIDWGLSNPTTNLKFEMAALNCTILVFQYIVVLKTCNLEVTKQQP